MFVNCGRAGIEPDARRVRALPDGLAQHPGRFDSRIENRPPIARVIATIHRTPGQINQGQRTFELPDPIALCVSVPFHVSGKPVGFTVPVADTGKVSLSLLPRTPEAKPIVSRRSLFSREDDNEGPVPVTLSLRGGRGTTKLMRGYYVIVPLYGREREPRWSSYRLRMTNHRYALENVIDSRPAGFEHAVVKIAHVEEQA